MARCGAPNDDDAADDDDDTADDDDDDDDDTTVGDDDTTADDDDATDADGMYSVPTGTVEMGCDETMNGASSCDGDELPARVVTVSAFRIDAFEVTKEEFVTFLNEYGNDCGESDCVGAFANPEVDEVAGVWAVLPGLERQPMLEVTWYGARDYCAWAGQRLPTEAEWARAARGDVPTVFTWGSDEPDCKRAIYGDGCGEGRPWDVDDGIRERGRSPFGVWDMGGNAWEWVQDRYAADYYEWGPDTDPPGPATGDSRVVRGGGWNSNSTMLDVWVRWGRQPNSGAMAVGFRCGADP